MTRCALVMCATLSLLLVCTGAAPTGGAPSIFVATAEFQEIQDGQEVPAGLHYRMNLATGMKEAKLIDPDEKDPPAGQVAAASSTAVAAVVTTPKATETAAAAATPPEVANVVEAEVDAASGATPRKHSQFDMMESVFEALPGPDGDEAREVLGTKSTVTEEQYQRALKLLWKKRQQLVADAGAHLRDEAREIHLLTKTMNDGNITAEAKEDALYQMQDLVTQIDNARDYVTLGGLGACVTLVQDKHATLAPLAAWVIGTAAQNDDVVQDAGLKAGAIEALVATLLHTADTFAASTMVAKGLFALSALTRNNVGAVKALMAADGLAVIASSATHEPQQEGSSCKVRIKSIAFMDDLLISVDDMAMQAVKAPVVAVLGEVLWCDLVVSSLPLCTTQVWQEKVLHGMTQLKAKAMCGDQLSSPATKQLLEGIELPLHDSDDEFQKELHFMAQTLL